MTPLVSFSASFTVVHPRVAVRALPSTSARIIGVVRAGKVVQTLGFCVCGASLTSVGVNGNTTMTKELDGKLQVWVKLDMNHDGITTIGVMYGSAEAWMLVDGSAVGVGKLLEPQQYTGTNAIQELATWGLERV